MATYRIYARRIQAIAINIEADSKAAAIEAAEHGKKIEEDI
jgi:hypothetical protein